MRGFLSSSGLASIVSSQSAGEGDQLSPKQINLQLSVQKTYLSLFCTRNITFHKYGCHLVAIYRFPAVSTTRRSSATKLRQKKKRVRPTTRQYHWSKGSFLAIRHLHVPLSKKSCRLTPFLNWQSVLMMKRIYSQKTFYSFSNMKM